MKTGMFCIGLLCLCLTQARASDYCDSVSGNLVVNCGFETGDFTGWSLSGNDVPGELNNLYGVEGTDPVDGISPNSGSYQAFVADLDSNATTLSQSLTTVAGDEYSISFFLAQDTPPTSSYGNELSVSFDGNVLASLSDIGVEGYTRYSFTGVTSDNSTDLSLTLGNSLGEFLLDDVTVVYSPEPSTWTMLLGGVALPFMLRRKSRLVQ